MPTLKNMSRAGSFKNKTLPACADFVVGHLMDKSRFYANTRTQTPQKNSSASQPAPPAANLSAASELEAGAVAKLSTLLVDLVARVEAIEKSVKLALTATATQTHPAVLAAIDHLESTRRHVMTQLDAQRQGTTRSATPREFESASAMDAQRILAGISRLNDTVARLTSENQKS